MAVSYESAGRTNQKRRTRDALVEAAQALLVTGTTPTVEQVAEASGVSRRTAYRYFPSQRALVMAAVPQLEQSSLLGADPPGDAAERLDLVVAGQVRVLRDYEPQLRAALRFSLEPAAGPDGGSGGASEFRTGRAVDWFAEALTPLASTHPTIDRRRLALAIRSCCGIEALVWLVDVGGVTRAEAFRIMTRSARSLLAAETAAAGPERG